VSRYLFQQFLISKDILLRKYFYFILLYCTYSILRLK